MRSPELTAIAPMTFANLQTMVFLQLAAGGLLLFMVRRHGSMFLPPFPSAPLFFAIVGTQIVAVLICAFGVLVPALPWLLISFVWPYVLVWMVVMDILKLAYFHILDRRETEPSQIHTPLVDGAR